MTGRSDKPSPGISNPASGGGFYWKDLFVTVGETDHWASHHEKYKVILQTVAIWQNQLRERTASLFQ